MSVDQLYLLPWLQRIVELEATNKDLGERLNDAEQENENLQEIQQDTQSLTESDKDANTLLHNLRVRYLVALNSYAMAASFWLLET